MMRLFCSVFSEYPISWLGIHDPANKNIMIFEKAPFSEIPSRDEKLLDLALKKKIPIPSPKVTFKHEHVTNLTGKGPVNVVSQKLNLPV